MPEAARVWGHIHSNWTMSLALAGDASLVAAMDYYTLRLHNRGGEELWHQRPRGAGAAAMPRDGSFVAAASEAGGEALTLYDPSGAVRWHQTSNAKAWPKIAVHPSGEMLVEVRGRTVTAYSAAGAHLFRVNPWPGADENPPAIVADPEFRRFAARGLGGEWVLLDAEGTERLRIGQLPWGCEVAFLPEGLLLHPDLSKPTDLVARTVEGAEQWRLATPAPIRYFAATASGGTIVVAGEDKKIRTYGSDRKEAKAVSARSDVTALAVDPRGRYWAAGTWGGALMFADVAGKVFFKEADAKTAWMRGPIVISEQGDIVVAGSSKGLVAAYYVLA